MTEAAQERVWKAFESLLQEVSGDQPYAEAMREIAGILEMLTEAFQTLKSRQDALSLISGLELSEKQIDMFEAAAAQAASILQSLVRARLQSAIKVLPTAPGGRPMSYTTQDRQSICEEVLAFVSSGLSPAEGKRRVARKRRLHIKTIDRVWSNRANSPAEPTRQDTEELLKKLIPILR